MLRGKPFPYVYMQWEKFKRKADSSINYPKTIKIDDIQFSFKDLEKKFSEQNHYRWWKGFFMIIRSVRNHRLTLVNLRYRYQSSRQKVLLCIWLKKYVVLWVVTAGWNNHSRSRIINQFELCIRRKETIYWPRTS